MVNQTYLRILDKIKNIFESEDNIDPIELYWCLRGRGVFEPDEISNIESAGTGPPLINQLFDILKTKPDNILELITCMANVYKWSKVSRLIETEQEKINSAVMSTVDLESQGIDSIGKGKLLEIWHQLPELGKGCYEPVRLYQDKNTNLQFAVKRVYIRHILSYPTNSEEVEAFNREIASLKNMHHERIVKYIGFQLDVDFFFIFMEYMQGGSIKDEIKSKGRLPESQAQHYTKQILEGLCYLHGHDIVHRDLKNANVLRDSWNNVKIADFGESKRLETIHGKSLHSNTISIVTYYFMAPEVIKSRDYGQRADMWSLGCSVVEMLTGRPPWGHLGATEAAVKTSNGEYPNYDLPSDISLTVQEFLKAVFSHDPAKRPGAEEALLMAWFNELT